MLVGCVLLAPLAVRAQGSPRIRRIGILSPGPGPSEDEFEVSVVPLRELGWIEGKNIVIERRYAKWNLDQLRPLADELVRLGVDMIVAFGTPAALAAKNVTTTVPIVRGTAGDPVGTGLVASLARPGGNITGYSIVFPEIVAKRAALVHELLPTAQRVAVMVSPKGFSAIADVRRKETDAAYRSLGVRPIFIEVLPPYNNNENAWAEGLREAVRQQAQALELPGANVGALIQAAIGYRLPVMVIDRGMVEAGGLLYLEVNDEDRGRRVAAMIDKILRGAKPADIPIEQPTRFTLVINLRTAKALGITVPQSLLLRADEVIR